MKPQANELTTLSAQRVQHSVLSVQGDTAPIRQQAITESFNKEFNIKDKKFNKNKIINN